MLDLVSLDQTEAKRRLRNYSLGMKQRLGIAHALLGDPSVLILDEPANGLDPAGIRWMRGLLKGYADRGGTVLLSSHLLNEVEQIADEMILIGRGKIVASGTKDELLVQRRAQASLTSPRSTTSCSPRPCRPRASRVAAAGTGLRVEAAPVEVGRVAAEQRDRPHRPALRRRWPRGAVPRADRGHPARRPPPGRPGVRTHRRSPGMSTAAAPPPMPLDISATPRVPMARLAKVEFRKALDTRAGRWFVIAILALVVVVEVIYAFAANDADKNFQDFIRSRLRARLLPADHHHHAGDQRGQPAQRAGDVHLEPRRSRVVVAKFIAGVALAAR